MELKLCSCGCTSGLSQNRVYAQWRAMHSRCKNPKNKNFHLYGGRGIFVCSDWDCFNKFIEDMGWPEKGWSIDRVDNSEGYYKGNCVWSNPKKQANNRRSNRKVTALGKTMTLSEWSDETGIQWSTIRQRIEKLGWTEEQAVSVPSKTMMGRKITKNFVKFRGDLVSIKDLSTEFGIPANTLRKRIVELNWSVEDATSRPVDGKKNSRAVTAVMGNEIAA